MNRITPATLLALATLFPAYGCKQEEKESPDPIIGLWESSELIGTERNELEVDETMRGESRIYFFIGPDAYYADFDAQVTVLDKGSRYELDMECQGGCSELNFEMDCDLFTDTQMDCDANGSWADYAFEWEKR